MSRSRRTRADRSSPASMAKQSDWERSARTPRIARRVCALACRSPRSRPAAGTSTRSIHLLGPAIGQARSVGVPPPALTKRRGPGRHRAAGCRLLAGNAASRQCRRSRPLTVRLHAPARQRDGAGIAARRRVVQNLRSEHCDRARHAVRTATDQTPASAGRFSRGSSCSPCWWIAKSFSRSAPPATAGCDRRRTTTISFFGTFTICYSTRAARKADTPTRWGALSTCGCRASAAGGAARMARKEDRFAQALRAFAGNLAARQAPA